MNPLAVFTPLVQALKESGDKGTLIFSLIAMASVIVMSFFELLKFALIEISAF